jgi:deoxyribose-phosphate aldolase
MVGTSQDITSVAGYIQHTLISNAVARVAWEKHVQACIRHHFHAAMVPAMWVKPTVEALRGSGVRTASWIDLPFGCATSGGKAYEACELVRAGADEIDLMPNVGFLLSGMEKEYLEDIRGVVTAAEGRPVKVITEMTLLTATQLEKAVALAVEAGVSYLKNLSGGAAGTATAEQVHRLRELAPAHVRVKASGGIRTAQQVLQLLAAGAALVGTSHGVEIVSELKGPLQGSQTPIAESVAKDY